MTYLIHIYCIYIYIIVYIISTYNSYVCTLFLSLCSIKNRDKVARALSGWTFQVLNVKVVKVERFSPGMGYTMVHMVYWKNIWLWRLWQSKKKNGPSRCWLLAKLHRAPGIFSCLLVKTLGYRSQRWTQRNAVKLPKIRSVFSKDTMVKHESELICARVKKQTESNNIKNGICVYIAYYIYYILCMYHIIQKKSLNIAIQHRHWNTTFKFARLLKAPDWAPHNSMHPSSKL